MKRLQLLDYGRFVAAICVVFSHYTFAGIANGKITSLTHIQPLIDITKYGYLGVEFFFMISGYVIFFSAKSRTAAEFAVSRAIRLYPAYWFAVLFTSFFALQWGGDLMSVEPKQIVANLSMLQSFFWIPHVDGVYWTLVYEITFYFAVFSILLLGLQKHLNAIFVFWPVLFCLALALDKLSLPYLGEYYYFFSAGTLFAMLKDRFQWPTAISLAVAFALCVQFAAGRAPALSAANGIEYSGAVIALIVTTFFLLFAFQNSTLGQSLRLPFSRTAGALTYPIYLIHAHFGYMLIDRFATEENKASFYAVAILLVLGVAFLINKLIEVRLAAFWRAFFIAVIGRPVNVVQGLLPKLPIARNR